MIKNIDKECKVKIKTDCMRQGCFHTSYGNNVT